MVDLSAEEGVEGEAEAHVKDGPEQEKRHDLGHGLFDDADDVLDAAHGRELLEELGVHRDGKRGHHVTVGVDEPRKVREVDVLPRERRGRRRLRVFVCSLPARHSGGEEGFQPRAAGAPGSPRARGGRGARGRGARAWIDWTRTIRTVKASAACAQGPCRGAVSRRGGAWGGSGPRPNALGCGRGAAGGATRARACDVRGGSGSRRTRGRGNSRGGGGPRACAMTTSPQNSSRYLAPAHEAGG